MGKHGCWRAVGVNCGCDGARIGVVVARVGLHEANAGADETADDEQASGKTVVCLPRPGDNEAKQGPDERSGIGDIARDIGWLKRWQGEHDE